MRKVNLQKPKTVYAVMNTNTGRFPAPHRYVDDALSYYNESKRPKRHEQFKTVKEAEENLRFIHSHIKGLLGELNEVGIPEWPESPVNDPQGRWEQVMHEVYCLLKETKLEVVEVIL